MDHSPAYIIKKYLVGEGLLVEPGDSGDWPAYVGILPDGKPDEVKNDIVACMDTSPVKDGRIMGTGENILHYGVQILLRSTAYNTGYAKMEALRASLESVNRDTIIISANTYRLENVTLTTGVVVVGQEEGSKRRELFSLNFLVTLKEI